jgi:hypothetical protein
VQHRARATEDAKGAALLALWGGYALYGLVYTTHIYSHTYYSLPLIPIVALSLGVVAGVVGDYLRVWLRSRFVRAAAASLLVVTMALGVEARAGMFALPRPASGDVQRRIEVYRQVGQLVHHSPRALVVEWTAGLWYYGWVSGRYWPNHWELEWQQTTLGLRAMSADARFATTDRRYWPAVGAIRPPPTVFIVLEPIELALEPDLTVYLSDFRVLARSPDYVIFDLTRRAGKPARSARATPITGAVATEGLLHMFPPTWRAIAPGMSTSRVVRTLGKPAAIVRRDDLRKPVESWFYGVGDDQAVVFINGQVFITAAASCCCCRRQLAPIDRNAAQIPVSVGRPRRPKVEESVETAE